MENKKSTQCPKCGYMFNEVQGAQPSSIEASYFSIKNWLAEQFPLDKVIQIGSKESEAEFLYVLNGKRSKNSGVIYFEIKSESSFKEEWAAGFKNNLRVMGGRFGILIAGDIKQKDLNGDVWFCDFGEFKSLFPLLRESIIRQDEGSNEPGSKINPPKMGGLDGYI